MPANHITYMIKAASNIKSQHLSSNWASLDISKPEIKFLYLRNPILLRHTELIERKKNQQKCIRKKRLGKEE